MGMKPITQKMIAQKLGVHSTTVSMALRGAKSIPDCTRQKIMAAARDMGYQPNAWARNLRLLNSRTIGMLSGFHLGEVMMGLLATVSRLLQRRGYEAILLDPGDGPQDFDEALQTLLSYRVAGLIVTPPDSGSPTEAMRGWMDHNEPTVYLRAWDNSSNNVIATDQAAGWRLAAEHLADLNHCHVACLGPANCKPRTSVNHRLQSTYIGISHEYDESLMDDFVGRALAIRPRPTAFICDSDLTAARSVRSLIRHGLRVPEDVSVIGFGDCLLAHAGTFQLTTLAHQAQEIARLVVDQILAMLTESAPRTFEPVMVAPRLIVRGSTTKASVSNLHDS